ncbi:MAG: hypothetical protein SFY68_12080 [Candidatus Sumerlaeia bacterium]|nr:hypothetical protein [Candidatus Sumerlaeia bacterium]
MVTLLLESNLAEYLFLAGAIVTPIVAWFLASRFREYKRSAVLLGLLGPVVLGLAALQSLLVSVYGLASLKTLLTVLVVSLFLGLMGGFYVRPEWGTEK